MTNKEIIEKIKKDYPIGTKFIPAHLTGREDSICEVFGYENLTVRDNWASIYSIERRNGHSYTGLLYNGLKWAEIISKPEVKPQEMEMIDGNWYSFNNPQEWLMKYKATEGEYIIQYKSCTPKSIGAPCFYKNTERWGKKANIVDLKPADMEEVYKYFPEERPKVDKITKLDPDKYYYVEWGGGGGTDYILKGHLISLELKTNKFHTTGNFNYPNYWHKIRLATEEEKQWLEACIKANKFIPKEEALKPVVPENLEGRYIKAKDDKPASISCILKGEVAKLGKNYGTGYNLDGSFNKKHSGYVSGEIAEYWELMPIGWTLEMYSTSLGVKLASIPSSSPTSLPDKWCIKFTDKKDVPVLRQYEPFKAWTFGSTGCYYNYTGKGCNMSIQEGHTEITFEQFKKWVLKKEKPMEKPSIPEYVECIKEAGYLAVGAIVKCKEEKGIFTWLYEKDTKYSYTPTSSIGNWDGYSKPYSDSFIKDFFKPSTKEAYDKQFVKPKPMKEEDWCVKITENNRESVKSWMDNKNKDYSLGAFYGIKNGTKEANTDTPWGFTLSTEEFYQKIGKTPSPPKQEEFKVGDWVVITTLLSRSKGSMMGIEGHVFQIEKVDKYEYYFATKATNTAGNCWPKDCLRKALPHEIPVQYPWDVCEQQKEEKEVWSWDVQPAKVELKKKGFDEKEHLSKPYNQMLRIEIKKINKKPIKQLFL